MISEYLHIADLIRKELAGTISLYEWEELLRWLDADPRNSDFYRQLTEESDFGLSLEKYRSAEHSLDFEGFVQRTEIRRIGLRRRLWRRTGFVAAVLVPVAVMAIFFSVRSETAVKNPDSILHRSSVAVLVTGDGHSYSLSDTTDCLPEGVSLKEEEERRVLSYKKNEPEEDVVQRGKFVVNQLIIPRGADYKIELSDGTLVWLGANSEISYPDVFADSIREVSLKGLAYFKVARDERHPFVVRTSRSCVRVLGTEFCVSDQSGAVSRITLVSGKVLVRDMHGSDMMLVPGQQACVTAQGSEVREVETFYYTSWKDGFFIFQENSFQEIMEELSEWYDFDYVFSTPELSQIKISARLKKYESIDPILELLGGMDQIAFECNGRTITVIKK